MEYRGKTGAEAAAEGQRHMMWVDLLRLLASPEAAVIVGYLAPDLAVSEALQAIGATFVADWSSIRTNDEAADLIDEDVRRVRSVISSGEFDRLEEFGRNLHAFYRYDGTMPPSYFGALFSLSTSDPDALALSADTTELVGKRLMEWDRTRRQCLGDFDELDTADESVWEANSWRQLVGLLIDKTSWEQLIVEIAAVDPAAGERLVQPFRQSLLGHGLEQESIDAAVPTTAAYDLKLSEN